MIQAFNTLVKPAYDKLNDTLGIKHIKVRQYSWEQPITVQVKEDGLVSFCNHAGAEVTLIASDWSDNPRMEKMIACDKCKAVYQAGEWYE